MAQRGRFVTTLVNQSTKIIIRLQAVSLMLITLIPSVVSIEPVFTLFRLSTSAQQESLKL